MQAFEYCVERDAGLHAGEVHAEAHVRSGSERHMRFRRAVDIEAVGLCVMTLVAVRGSDEDVQVSARWDVDTTQSRVPDAPARDHQQRRLPAQRFFDRRGAQLRVLYGLAELAGGRKKAEQQVAD